jgi:hypothetical protein
MNEKTITITPSLLKLYNGILKGEITRQRTSRNKDILTHTVRFNNGYRVTIKIEIFWIKDNKTNRWKQLSAIGTFFYNKNGKKILDNYLEGTRNFEGEYTFNDRTDNYKKYIINIIEK